MTERAEPVPINRYVYLVTKDDVTFRGALAGNDYGATYLELRGAQVAEFADGLPEPRWKTLDGSVVVPVINVSYMVERP